MKESLLFPIVVMSLASVCDVSIASEAIDYPGPQYRKQVELVSPQKVRSQQSPEIRVSTLLERAPFGVQPMPDGTDFSTPIRLFDPAPQRPATAVPRKKAK